MRWQIGFIPLTLFIGAILSLSGNTLAANQGRELNWDDLIAKEFSLEVAPVDLSLEGQLVRLPGYVVPVEMNGELISEFLLVPYAGACIHTPPPPANQIVHVVAKEPFKGAMHRLAVWASGKMIIEKQVKSVGFYAAESSYKLVDAEIEFYSK